MTRTSRYRAALIAVVALAANVVLTVAAASASIDMVVGARAVAENAPVADCSSKARTALTAVLGKPFEAGDGTGQWLAYGPADSAGHSSAAAAIHCFPVNKGYVATFTCTVDVPPNPVTATDLCTKLTGAFGSGKTAKADLPAGSIGRLP